MQLSLQWYGPRTTVKWVRLGPALLWTMRTKRAKIDAWRWNNRARLITVVPRRHIFKTLNDRASSKASATKSCENCGIVSSQRFDCQISTTNDCIPPDTWRNQPTQRGKCRLTSAAVSRGGICHSGAVASSAQFHSRTVKHNSIASLAEDSAILMPTFSLLWLSVCNIKLIMYC